MHRVPATLDPHSLSLAGNRSKAPHAPSLCGCGSLFQAHLAIRSPRQGTVADLGSILHAVHGSEDVLALCTTCAYAAHWTAEVARGTGSEVMSEENVIAGRHERRIECCARRDRPLSGGRYCGRHGHAAVPGVKARHRLLLLSAEGQRKKREPGLCTFRPSLPTRRGTEDRACAR